MAELLIQVVDKTNPDPELDAKCYKRGDVISILPDGAYWGDATQNPLWRIIRVVGLSPEELEALLTLSVPEDMSDGMLSLKRRRARFLDLDSPGVPAPMRAWLNDSKRAVPILDLSAHLPLAALRTMLVRRSALASPRVIG